MNSSPDLTSLTALPTHEIDLVGFGVSAAGVVALCDEHLARASRLLGQVKALAQDEGRPLCFEEVLAPADDIALETALAGGIAHLVEETHPDPDVRAAARTCRPKVSQFFTELMLDATYAAIIRRYAAAEPELTGTRRRLLEELLRGFRRNGLFLPPEGQRQLRELNAELTSLAQEFSRNLAEARHAIRVTPEQLRGLPASFIETHPVDAEGMVLLTTDYPDYFPVVTFAEDRSVARRLNELFDNRASDKNLAVLDRVLGLRQRKAELLGYSTWAEYVLEANMAKTPEVVREFLDQAREAVRAPARGEYSSYLAERARLGHAAEGPIPVYDRLYLEQKVRERTYGFDARLLSEYFEVEAVVRGALTLVSELFRLEIRELDVPARWHPEVRVLEVCRHGELRGRVYLDLHPREAKYKHAAMFEIRPGKRLASGEYLTPIVALVANFPRPGATPALLTLDDVTTFFHELGHVLHQVLTREELCSFSGTNTAHDFVETPSQVMEEWSFRREALDLFARHHATGERIPDALYQAMVRSRTVGRALATERQVSLAMLDFEYHSRRPPLDTDAVRAEVMARYQSFAYPDGTHFQATFAHLMGYDAAYYGYQWALAIARDVLTRFEQDGFMNANVAEAWLEQVLSRGAGADERLLVEQFLGRKTNLEAYAAYLQGRQGP